ncbi:MAG TPA: TMEM175 family protein [Phototrophicaceae bacterium]|jgi:uncharacterized membrane protein|nr:TMEM175 family protein [Phototrophicaceae bacterium]
MIPEQPPTPVNHTSRLEAFSDGIFSIAVTLLVFSLQVPHDLPPGKTLLTALGELWPGYFAFFVSFTTIGIMWINHHNMFKLINRTDHTLLVLNGLLLMMITFVNFPTAVLGTYIQNPDEGHTAAVLYNATFVVTAVFYNLLWRYATYHRRLIDPAVPQTALNRITVSYSFGPLLYLAAAILSFFSVPAGLGLSALLAIFFAIPSGMSLTD